MRVLMGLLPLGILLLSPASTFAQSNPCEDLPPLKPANAWWPEFEINKKGDVIRNCLGKAEKKPSSTVKRGTVALDKSWFGDHWLMIEYVPIGTPDKPEVISCGKVDPGQAYWMEGTDRGWFRASIFTPANSVDQTRLSASIQEYKKDNADLIAKTESSERKYRLGALKKRPELQYLAVLRAALVLEPSRAKAWAMLDGLRTELSDEASFEKAPGALSANKAVVSAAEDMLVDPSTPAGAIRFEKGYDALRALLVEGSDPNAEEQKVFCKDATFVDTLTKVPADLPVIEYRFDLPATDGAHTVQVSGLDGNATYSSFPIDGRATIWVNDLTGPVAIERSDGKALPESTPQKAVAEFLAIVLSLYPKLKIAAVPDPLVGSRLALCKGIASPAPKLGPILPNTSAVASMGVLEQGKEYEVSVCDGKKCVTSTESSNLRVKAVVATGSRTLVAVAIGIDGVFGEPDTFASWSWRPVAGTAGSDQLFLLTREERQVRHFSLSLQLALYPSFLRSSNLRLGLAAGTSLVIGDELKALHQFSLQIALRFSNGVALMVGPGLRSKAMPYDASDGAVVAITRTGNEMPAAPVVATHDVFRPVLLMSLSIELSTLGDAGSALLKAAGVSK